MKIRYYIMMFIIFSVLFIIGFVWTLFFLYSSIIMVNDALLDFLESIIGVILEEL